MGRHIGPVCRLCRREGTKLFLKGTRCDTPKCAVDRREGMPGMHQFRRGKASEYAIRLREKQKVKRYYGIFERQFRKYYAEASRRAGNTGRLCFGDGRVAIERLELRAIHGLGIARDAPACHAQAPPISPFGAYFARIVRASASSFFICATRGSSPSNFSSGRCRATKWTRSRAP